MSSGGAEVIGELLKIPVAREITIAALWWFALQYALVSGEFDMLALATLVAMVMFGLLYWRHHRDQKNSEGGGGGMLLLVVLMMIMALPLLVIAWRRRKAAEKTA